MAARGSVAQLDVLGLIAEYGSIRKAAAATGISKSTLYDQSRGSSGAAAKTVSAITSAVTDATKAFTGLIGGLAGGKPAEYRETAKSVARQNRQSPALVQQQIQTQTQIQAAAGTNADGSTSAHPEFDSLGRRITDEQDDAYKQLLADYEAGTLDGDRYAKFAAYQLGSGSGGGSADIAPI